MMNIYTHEYNIALEKTTWLPISTGCLQAYALTHDIIREGYEFMPFRFMKMPLREVAPYNSPGVAAFSSSMWNMNMNLTIAERVKREFPNCLIVFGGVDVPPDPKFLEKYPFIDIAANGEGEQTFTDILIRNLESRDFGGIPSISWRHEDEVVRNEGEPPFTKDLSCYPIPYISGVFDYLLDGEYKFQVILETNRGCPFKCSFCFWGEGTMKMGKKYRFFELENIKETADWCGKNDIRYIFCADANFGTFKRDKEIAEYFVSTKEKYEAPEKFRVCYAKNAADRVFEVAKVFHRAGMEKALTLARQSNDETTLINIDRGNIKLSVFNSLAKRAGREGIPIYTELILGMPGETYDSFITGIESMLQQSVNAQVFIYLCTLLTNTTMALPEYRKRHGIITRHLAMTEQHYKIHGMDDIEEREEVIVGTNTMPIKEWEKSLLYAWYFQVLYSLRAGIFPMLYLQFDHKLEVTKFMEYLIDSADGPIFKDINSLFKETIASILSGGSRDIILEGSPIYWPVEEVAFLMISENKDAFYEELRVLLIEYLLTQDIKPDREKVSEVMLYQKCRVISQNQEAKTIPLSYNLPQYFEDLCQYKEDVKLQKEPCKLHTAEVKFADRHNFALKILVYGRKSDGMLGDIHPSRDLSEYTITK
ncbi:MAG: B12-binding domain-containing radical SAM protein [Promethearchaeota archaeon]|jgi:putative methyltransferase